MKKLLIMTCAAAVVAAVPTAHAEDAYIESAGVTGMDTEYHLKPTSRIEMDFQLTTLEQTDQARVFGADNNAAALTRALEHCRTVGASKLVLAPGKYYCRAEVGVMMDGLKDLRLQIEYRGDIGTLFLENEMISDNFCNGDTWEIGLNEYREKLKHTPLVLRIAPLRKGARVNVESAMAARNEEVREVIGELTAVRCQPVYELKL